VDVYNKLDETIISRVTHNLDYLNLESKDIENNIINEVVEVQDDSQKELIREHLEEILDKHHLRLFIDAVNGKQLVEYISINTSTHEPITKRSLIKLFTLPSEPYNIYMVGVGYTMSILKPLSYLD
jgi:hypothetical protein